MTTVGPPTSDELPRELLPGLWWLGQCLEYPYQGRLLHAYNAAYLLSGDRCSVLVEGGFPGDVAILERQVETLLADGAPPLKYLFASHTETPHCAAFGRLLQRFPDTVVCGDVSDLHLVFPEFADRLRPLAPGDALDLGGTELRVTEAVFRDYISTRWAFDTSRRVLFTSDGLAYTHYHLAGHCARVAEEAPDLDLPDMTALFAELAFYWTRYVDLEPYIARLRELIFDELDVALIAPTHGLPVSDPAATMPRVFDGLRLGSAQRRGKEEIDVSDAAEKLMR